MALPLIAAIAAGVILVVGGIVVYKIYIDGVGQVEVKEGKEDDKADITVLLVGEVGAGKKTLTNIIRKGKFPKENIKMFNAYSSIWINPVSLVTNKILDKFVPLQDKKIKIICTSGDEQHFKSIYKIQQT